MENQLLTMTSVAKELGITMPTLRKWLISGGLKSIDLNGKRRIRRCTLDKFLINAEKISQKNQSVS